MKRLFIAVLMILSINTAFAQIVNKAEYFFDTDPGPGNGTPISISTPGVSVSFPAQIPINLSPGFHWLGIRVKDSDGKWSLFQRKDFYVSQPGTDLPIITKAEYFFDTDPGVGSGTPLNFQNTGFSLSQTFPITVPVSMTGGTHYLAIRVKDQAGHWSLFQRDTIVVGGTAASITCPGNVVVTAASGQCSSIVNNIDPTVSPQGTSYTYSLTGATTGNGAGTASGKSFNVGVTTVTYALTGAPATSCSFNVTVNSGTTASVTINTIRTSICSGQQVTFTATPVNGGNTPSYQWKLNGNNIAGAIYSTYQSSSLANGDVVSVVMTSSISCASPSSATSNLITMTVHPILTPSVSITASATTICSGQSVTFTATATNGGIQPIYQWVKNGSYADVGAVYQTSALANGDSVYVILYNTTDCIIDDDITSNVIHITTSQMVTPSVTISASATTICLGQLVTFTATPANGDNNPNYEWTLNGNAVGSNINTYQSSTLHNGDLIRVTMESSLSCASPRTVYSNTIAMTVGSGVTPSVSISASAIDICAGQQVTFTATPTNGGNNPTYQWKLNGNNVGSNSPTYQTTSLANADTVKVVMTSSLSCATFPIATSNSISMDVSTSVLPSVSITADLTYICQGELVKFTATPTNGGNPTYQWKLNGNNVGTNSNIYQSTGFANNDSIEVVMTSSLGCAVPRSVTSNNVFMTVTTAVTPQVSIESSSSYVCAGTLVTFTATPVNGGTPSYQWKLNGNNVGIDYYKYENSVLSGGDIISVSMTTTLGCVTTSNVVSNSITMEASSSSTTYYRDLDGDGYGNSSSGTIQACGTTAGYSSNNSDCNDNNAAINPGAAEVCGNGIDDDCNGQTDVNCTEGLPVLIVKTYPAKEGDVGFTTVDIEVRLDRPAVSAVRLNYATSNDDAIAGSDYVAANGVLIIPPGSSSATIQVKVIGDLLKESNERFWLNFTSPVNVVLPDDPHCRIMIIDNDKGKVITTAANNTQVPVKEETFKIPTVTKRNHVWVIPQIGNYENEVLIVNVQGQVVSRFVNYHNQTALGNVSTGLYFYRIRIMESPGQYKYHSGRLLITE